MGTEIFTTKVAREHIFRAVFVSLQDEIAIINRLVQHGLIVFLPLLSIFTRTNCSIVADCVRFELPLLSLIARTD